MDIKKALASILEDYNINKSLTPNNQRKNMYRSRNSQKTPLIQQSLSSHKQYYFFKPINEKANTMAMKYVQSHHPSIKNRVIKILSHHRNLPANANNKNVVSNFVKDGLSLHMNNYHKQSLNTITFRGQSQRKDLSRLNQHSNLSLIDANQFQGNKTCKISSITLFQRPLTRSQRSKTISSNTKSQSNKQFTPQKKFWKKSRHHSTFKENGFFTGWEPVDTENQSFFS